MANREVSEYQQTDYQQTGLEHTRPVARNETRMACLLTALSLWFLGCQLMTPPPGFVSLDDYRGEFDFRAVSPDGLVISAQELDHEPEGDLAFWTRAIENELRGRSGYALLETRDVRTNDGVPGKQLRFGHDEGGTPYLYYVSVFVTDDCIYLVEAGGEKKLLSKHEASLDAAMRSLDAD